MKNKIALFSIIGLLTLTFACKKQEFYDLIVAGEHPFRNTTDGEVFKTIKYDSLKAVLFKVPKLSEWNIFYKKKDKETFLTNYCISDCDEKIDKYEWSKDGIYFAMLIEGSNRYSMGTRLFLFDFNDEVVIRKVDIKDQKIRSFRFGEKAFYYTNDKNEEAKINL
jgi:hypothetical protein